jgi:hypothetical protein
MSAEEQMRVRKLRGRKSPSLLLSATARLARLLGQSRGEWALFIEYNA